MMSIPEFSPIVRSPKFFVRKEDKKYFFANKEEKCWLAKDGERVDAVAYPCLTTEKTNSPIFQAMEYCLLEEEERIEEIKERIFEQNMNPSVGIATHREVKVFKMDTEELE